MKCLSFHRETMGRRRREGRWEGGREAPRRWIMRRTAGRCRCRKEEEEEEEEEGEEGSEAGDKRNLLIRMVWSAGAASEEGRRREGRKPR